MGWHGFAIKVTITTNHILPVTLIYVKCTIDSFFSDHWEQPTSNDDPMINDKCNTIFQKNIITWEDTTHELRPVKAHGVRQEDDLVTEGLLAKCLVRDRGRGGAVPLSPAGGCPGHEVALEVSLTLVEAHNLSLRQCPAVTQNYVSNEGGDPPLPEPKYVCYILNFSIQIFKKLNLNDVL